MTALRAFCTWMVEDGRASSSPLARLKNITVTDEKRFGAFTDEQMRRLIEHCEQATDVWGYKQRFVPQQVRRREFLTATASATRGQ